MTNEPESKPTQYGFLLVLAALALMTWLVARFTGSRRSTKSKLDQQSFKLRQEIESLQILQEQAKLDLRRVRVEQREVLRRIKAFEDRENGKSPNKVDYLHDVNGHATMPS